MKLSALCLLLAATGLPVTYSAWPENEAPPLPWICYREAGSDNFAADGVAYHPVKSVAVELYSALKDPASEAKIESALTAAGIFWDKNETYIDSERCYQITYEIEV